MTSSAAPQHTILLVHDDVLVRMKLSDFLRKCEYHVLEASGADEALVVLQHPGVKIDIVFSDLEMPGTLDGFALSTWVRAHRPEVEVILAGTVPRSVNAAAELCRANSLPKPYEARALLDQIKRLLAARQGHKDR